MSERAKLGLEVSGVAEDEMMTMESDDSEVGTAEGAVESGDKTDVWEPRAEGSCSCVSSGGRDAGARSGDRGRRTLVVAMGAVVVDEDFW